MHKKYQIDGMSIYGHSMKKEKEIHWIAELLIVIAFVALLIVMWTYHI